MATYEVVLVSQYGHDEKHVIENVESFVGVENIPGEPNQNFISFYDDEEGLLKAFNPSYIKTITCVSVENNDY